MNIEDLISQYIDGTLPSEAEAELHHRLAVSPEARQLFRAHIMLKGVARDQRVLHAPSPDLRAKLFGRLEREEGMVPPPSSDSAPHAADPVSGPAAVAVAAARSVPSNIVAKRTSRRRRVVPWLIPILMAGLLIGIVWNVGDKENAQRNANMASRRVEDVPPATANRGDGMANPSAPGAAVSAESAPRSDRDAATGEEHAAGPRGGSANGLAARAPVRSGASDSRTHFETSEFSNGSSGASYKSGTVAADGDEMAAPESAKDVAKKDIAAKEDNALGGRVDRYTQSKEQQRSAVKPSTTVVPRSDRTLSNEITEPARNRAGNGIASHAADGATLADGYLAQGGEKPNAPAERAEPSLQSNSVASKPATTDRSGSFAVAQEEETTQTPAKIDQKLERDMKTDASGKFKERVPATVPQTTVLTMSEGSGSVARREAQVLSRNPADSLARAQTMGHLQSQSASMATAAPPPPPSAPFDGAPMQSPPQEDFVAPSQPSKSTMAMDDKVGQNAGGQNEPLGNASTRLDANSADSTRALDGTDMAASAFESDNILAASQAESFHFTVGGQVSLGLIGTQAVNPQLMVKGGVEFDGAHRVYAVLGLSGYREIGVDTVLKAVNNGVEVFPTEPNPVRDTTNRFNELWGGLGYRYTLRLAPSLSVGLGGWAGAGKRYYRFGSELPLTLDLNRSLHVELVPSLEYTHPFSGAGTSTETQIDPALPYSEQRRRSKTPEGTGDFNFGFGIGAFVTW